MFENAALLSQIILDEVLEGLNAYSEMLPAFSGFVFGADEVSDWIIIELD